MALAAFTLLAVSCGKEKKVESQAVKVKTMEAAATSLYGGQNYSGTIEEDNGVSLSFPVGGTLKQTNIAEGQNVGAGQLIAVLDATTLGNLSAASQAGVAQAEALLSQAEQSAAQARDAYKRMKLLHDNGSLPEIKWVEVQTRYQQAKDAVAQARGAVQTARAQRNISQKNLHDTRLYAPSAGYISKKLVEAGQNVAPGQPVAMLVDIRQVKVKINVPEDVADPVTRSYEVKAMTANRGRQLLPGMVCDVYLQGPTTASLTLPANIIQIDLDNRPFVWTVVGGVAQRRYVTLGESVGDDIEIAGGLSPHDRVIVEGQQKVSNGMKVQ